MKHILIAILSLVSFSLLSQAPIGKRTRWESMQQCLDALGDPIEGCIPMSNVSGNYIQTTLQNVLDDLNSLNESSVDSVYVEGDTLYVVFFDSPTLAYYAPNFPDNEITIDLQYLFEGGIKIIVYTNGEPTDSVSVFQIEPTQIWGLYQEGADLCIDYAMYEAGTYVPYTTCAEDVLQQQNNYFILDESICIIEGLDTICVSQDSFYTTDTTLCVITMGDTLCTPITQQDQVAISDLFPALKANTINNGNFMQEFQWNTLSASGFKLSSTSTAAAGHSQRLLDVRLSGANNTSGQQTFAGYFTNTHTGSGALNYGVYSVASGGSSNIGVFGNGSSVGVSGTSSTGSGVSSNSTSGNAFFGLSSSGTGIWAQSTTGLAGRFIINPVSNNTVATCASFLRGASAPANGIGISLDLHNLTTVNNEISNQIISKWTDVTSATRDSEFSITGVDNATTNVLLTISGAGIFTLTQGLQDFADDTAAALGGIPVNGLYRNGSIVMIRFN